MNYISSQDIQNSIWWRLKTILFQSCAQEDHPAIRSSGCCVFYWSVTVTCLLKKLYPVVRKELSVGKLRNTGFSDVFTYEKFVAELRINSIVPAACSSLTRLFSLWQTLFCSAHPSLHPPGHVSTFHKIIKFWRWKQCGKNNSHSDVPCAKYILK